MEIYCWHFVAVQTEQGQLWTWRAIGRNGQIEKKSDPFPDYGKAVADAISNGFMPTSHDWKVVTPTGSTHYRPGAMDRRGSTTL